MADVGGPLSEVANAAEKHMQSLEVKLGELAKRVDTETVHTVRELQQVLDELRGLLR